MEDFWNGSYYRKNSTVQEKNAHHILKHYSFKGDELVLDIGCGPGNITSEIARRVPKGQVIGIDPSAQMLSEALLTYQEIPHLHFFEQRAETFHFNDQFDLITSFTALHFVLDHAKFLNRLAPYLKPGGRVLFLMSANPNSLIRTILEEKGELLKVHPKKLVCYHSVEDYESLIKGACLIKDRLEVIPTKHSFADAKELSLFLMTFLPFATRLPYDQALPFADDISQAFCQKQDRAAPLELTTSLLLVEAHLPANA